MQRYEAVIAPVPAVKLFAHASGEMFFSGHPHGRWRVDPARDENLGIDPAVVGESYAGRAATCDDDLAHVCTGNDLSAAILDHAGERIGEARGAADRERVVA